MTDSEPNSLRRELAAIAPAGDHPDADMLTAFAEGSLLERECGAVLEHLAGCAECRALLSLAAEEVSEKVAVLKPVARSHSLHSPLRTWLPWGAAAAGIAIACSVALRHEATRPTLPSPIAQAPPANAPQKMAQVQAPRAALKSLEKSATNGRPSKQRQVSPESTIVAGANPVNEQAKQDSLQEVGGLASNPALRSEPSPATNAQSADLRLAVPQAAPVPAFTNAVSANAIGGPQAPFLRPHWRINEQGQPERAFGNGPWQPALGFEGSRMHVLSILNGEVWVGGENSRVYRSSDEGMTWHAIPLPAKNGSGHSIVHIRFETAQSGIIEASDGTTWATTDGGNTWK